MYNTPPTFGWYLAGLVFQWLKRNGGLTAMAKINERKAGLLYAAIDSSDFYANPVDPACRSWMNIPLPWPMRRWTRISGWSQGGWSGDAQGSPLGWRNAGKHL